MNRIITIIIAIFAIGIIGCTDETYDRYNHSDNNKIGFKAMVGKNSLFKASELTSKDFDDFIVYAYRTDADIAVANLPGDENTSQNIAGDGTTLTSDNVNVIEQYIHSLGVSRSGGNDWSYDGAFYWPEEPGNRLQFYAYAGDSFDAGSWIQPDVNSESLEDRHPRFTYTIADQASEQKDFVTARELNKHEEDKPENASAKVVDLIFKHALTQINFSLKGEDNNLSYEVSKIEIKDAINKGTYSYYTNEFIASTSANDKANYKYNTLEIPLDYVGYRMFGNGDKYDESENPIGGQALMLMPQSFTGSFEVTYNIKTRHGGTVYENKVASVDFSNNNAEWDAGKKIRYNLILPIGTNMIQFDADITDWDEEEDIDDAKNYAIEFNSTRAIQLNKGVFEMFKVWAYQSTSNMPSINAIPYFQALEINKSSSNEWNYDNTIYWPQSNKLSFFGIGGDDNVSINYQNDNYPSFIYTVADNTTSQKDLVIASKFNQTTPNSSNTRVGLEFKHILTQVDFSLSTDNHQHTFVIKKIWIEGAKNSGRFTYDLARGDWSSLSGSQTYYYINNTTGITIPSKTDGYTSFEDGSNTLMLMPQNFTGKILVNYDIKNNNGYVKQNETAELDYSQTSMEWKVGNKIRYNLILPVGGDKFKGFSTDISDRN